MRPILYESTETAFDTNGLGVLTDAISCTVTEERNGTYELEMKYPIDGIHYEDLALRRIITVPPNPTANVQPFRIYEITRPIGGKVTVSAEHISYDLSGIPLDTFTASTASAAMTMLSDKSVTDNPFTFWTDLETAATMNHSTPSSVRGILGGVDGSVIDVYGGEWEFDGYTCKLHKARGEDRGVTIRYGKNLTDLEQEENCANVYTGVYPYWTDIDGNLVQLDDRVVYASGTYDFTRILMLDLSDEWDEAPTQAQLQAKAEAYIEANNIGTPSVSLEVSFAQLAESEEYKDYALLERVDLCDYVTVEFPDLGVSATAECIKTKYDVLRERYDTISLGDAKYSIADTIAQTSSDISSAVSSQAAQTKTALEQAIESATSQITGNLGGYVVLHSSTGADYPDELLIMDTADIDTATKVWRWNKSGLGYSSTGYSGTYGLAMTQDGAIVADYITTGILSAGGVKLSGLLSILSKSGTASGYVGYAEGSSTLTTGGETFTTTGMAMMDATQDCYFIATGSGVRMQAGESSFYIAKDGELRMDSADGLKRIVCNKSNVHMRAATDSDNYSVMQVTTSQSGLYKYVDGSTVSSFICQEAGAQMAGASDTYFYASAASAARMQGGSAYMRMSSDGTQICPASGKSALYLDWTSVVGADGNNYWALCGYSSAQ